MTQLRRKSSVQSADGWYVARGQDYEGPFAAELVVERLRRGELNWMQFAWRRGMASWSRFCDLPEFRDAAPAAPARPPAVAEAGRAAEPAKSGKQGDEVQWFLHWEGSQQGPYRQGEVEDLLRTGKVSVRAHAWKSGMSGWVRLGKVRAFEEIVGTLERVKPPEMKKKTEPVERRTAPRKPLVARLFFSDQKEVFEGLCRDVSLGGMQVLTAHLPGEPGTRLRLNINPNPGKVSGKKPRFLEPFVAEGIVVRILEDQRGFSFRFERLQPEARKAIEAWIAGENRELSSG